MLILADFAASVDASVAAAAAAAAAADDDDDDYDNLNILAAFEGCVDRWDLSTVPSCFQFVAPTILKLTD